MAEVDVTRVAAYVETETTGLIQATRVAAYVETQPPPSAPKTYYLTETKGTGVEHLLLQEGGSAPTSAVMTTGWIVSNLAPTRYAMMDSAVERGSGSFGTTVLPNAGPNNTIGDCFRSLYKHKGTFAAGNWSFSLETIGISRATSTHDGLIRIKFYRSVNANGSGATDITGTIHETSGYTNLTNTVRQALTLTVDPGEIVLDNEYLFIQVCLKGTGAGDNAASDTHLCTGASNYITTTDYTESTTPNPKRTTNAGASVEYVDTTNYALTTDIGASVEYIDDHTDLIVSTVDVGVEYGGIQSFGVKIASGNDDAHERGDGWGGIDISAAEVRVSAYGNISGQWWAGLRFQGIQVPPGVRIVSARLSVWANSSGDPYLSIHCENVDDSVDFVANADVVDRARTTAYTDWFQDGLSTTDYSASPDFSSAVQEVIDRPGWSAGNDLMVILKGGLWNGKHLYFWSYDGDATKAAVLSIQYSLMDVEAIVSTVGANVEYLEEQALSSPIVSTIGAMVETGPEFMVIDGPEDTYVSELVPSTNYGTDTVLDVRNSAGSRLHTLMWFDLTSIPADATISYVRLELVGGSGGWNDTLYIYRILAANSSWTELGATWDYRVGTTRWAGDVGDDGGVDAGCSVSGTDHSATEMASGPWNSTLDLVNSYNFDLTEFETMRANNYGFIIRRTDANVILSNIPSADYPVLSGVGRRPRLRIGLSYPHTTERISALGAMVEYNVYAQRQVSALGTMVEYNNYAQRQITALGVMVEYSPVVAGRKWGPIVQSG